MHATSLQGFGYGNVVHQFEKRCKVYLIFALSSQNIYTCVYVPVMVTNPFRKVPFSNI
ncbi:MAG: hypothetical protein O4805_12760 [Trichodesmium sp. St16_bin2-tuft]|nr:hypothetical protein [Trichodesmium sp. MAG_R02]MDE5087959.1 hypothetical protein [Trichodesmium sp. St16_bin2-tuft]MDE5111135.1 hypothetical protein [Trichodesmium sp. St7_bin2_1]MDE5116479.1 hypothetical protein [Trichodesmium sp. St2_bin2_1]MDE5120735.1 hypothetical protein [Trichodesmium sp. St19_bin1]